MSEYLFINEVKEIPSIINNQFSENQDLINDVADELRKYNPKWVMTLGRGSSKNALSFINYLIAQKLNIFSESLRLSYFSMYQTQLKFGNNSLVISVSQSGQSEDLLLALEHCNRMGTPTLSLLNNLNSKAYAASKFTLPICAGSELAVAASKSMAASLSLGAGLVSYWKNDLELTRAMFHLGDDLEKILKNDWSENFDTFYEKLVSSKKIFIVSRGYGMSVADEFALKLQEVCQIPAFSYSAAEIMHGPISLIDDDSLVIILGLRGPALISLLNLEVDLKKCGATVLLAAPGFVREKFWEIKSTHAEELDSISALQSIYQLVYQIAMALGLNPDRPRNLIKETTTK